MLNKLVLLGQDVATNVSGENYPMSTEVMVSIVVLIAVVGLVCVVSLRKNHSRDRVVDRDDPA